MNLLVLYAFSWIFILEGLCNGNVTNIVYNKIKTGNIEIEIRNKEFHLNIWKNDGSKMRNILFTRGSNDTSEEHFIEQDCEPFTTCILFANAIHTKIKADPNRETVHISRTINYPSGQLTDCYELVDGTDWFGGPQHRYQNWPIQNMSYKEEPYLPIHSQNMAVAERYWLSSTGVYIFVDEKDPLFLDQNNYKDKYLCLIAKNKKPYRLRDNISLNYDIGVFNDPKQAHENVIKKHYDKPTSYPNERMITHPIWSTWARYKININDSIVRTFANEILEHGFNNSQIEIDDNWETCYGSASFDLDKFPNVAELVSYLKEKHFRVTLWIHPFINLNCREHFNYAKKNNYFVKNTNRVYFTKWWQGTGAAIDFTNPKAVDWFVNRLKKLQALGFDSFKFDAGEVSWLPQISSLTGPQDLQPSIYTLNYTTNLAKYFGDGIEVRTGWRTQGLPIFIRMIDKDTTWSWNNGLPTLITTLLQMNLNGYSYVLPDMIGGNGYTGSFNTSELPPKEMFIRWLQANVFMPALQYSFVPWDYDNETISICKTYTDLHADIAPKIIQLMKKFVETGAPINPPIWWVDPLNVQAHKINDEYLLGEEILVAPVVKENSTARDIYLPTGKWKDANGENIFTGPTWIYNYPAPLNVLPYFYKIQ